MCKKVTGKQAHASGTRPAFLLGRPWFPQVVGVNDIRDVKGWQSVPGEMAGKGAP